VSWQVTSLLSSTGAADSPSLVHLLMVSTPRPFLFFGWIVALVTTLVVVYPFSTTARWVPRSPRWPTAWRSAP